jgi:hypothetical protein
MSQRVESPSEFQGVAVSMALAPQTSAGSYDELLVQQMYRILMVDRTTFEEADDYVHGRQRLPWAPTHQASGELAHLQRVSIANIMQLIVELPTEVSYVDDYRRGGEPNVDSNGMPKTLPEWEVWQRNRMDARQGVLYTAAATYGQSFLLVNNLDDFGNPREDGNIRLEILPTRNTVAFFYDPVNDIRPAYVLTIKTSPAQQAAVLGNPATGTPGLAVLWDSVNRYELDYTVEGTFSLRSAPIPHNLGADGYAPVVRYTCKIDDEGRTEGLVIPNVAHQDRINQATFNTNVTANYGSFKVRWASGLQVQFQADPNDPTQPYLDPVTKRPVPLPVEVSQARMLMSPDPNVKFGQLDETPLDGYLKLEERAFENFTTLAQFPPLAQITTISNISAEALDALETSFMRFVLKLQTSWGESTEEVMRLVCQASGDTAGATAWGGEVRWRDMRSKSLGIIADSFGKLAAQVGVPYKALWSRVPGVTRGDLREWSQLAEHQRQDELALASKVSTLGAAGQEALQALPAQPAQPWQAMSSRGGK